MIDLKSNRHKFVLILTVILILTFILMMKRVFGSEQLRLKTETLAIPSVEIIQAKETHIMDEIILPGNLQAWHEAPIYARTKGYLRSWHVDIGDQVKLGDCLATIETPELDEQLRQAEAHLREVLAKDELAHITAMRWLHLLKTASVSKQETDEKVDAAKALHAMVASARAHRDKLRQLVKFERVRAPFSGVITDRQTDIGQLINDGSQPMETKPLFHIAKTSPLRVYTNIPQNYASRINAGMKIKLHVPEYPGQTFDASLLETAHAFNPKTRTLLTQLMVSNQQGLLLPGGYTEVHFFMHKQSIRLPVNVLIFRAQGLQIAKLKSQQRVMLQSITIARDFGNEVEIDSGVNVGDNIILNPPDSIYTGQLVKLKS